MKVLITGHQGYIGAHLTKLAMDAGFEVAGCDIGLFDDCEWSEVPAPTVEWKRDFRVLSVQDLQGFDCVMHLAAISNDPMGEMDETVTYEVNREGTIDFALRCKEAGIPRFLFSSSCSIYGKGEKLDLDETANFNPVSAYAHSKVAVEKALNEMASEDFSPVMLRNATAYGLSPMLRIDLVANNLLGCALAYGDIRIMSDGSPWRPLVHCKDIANAFVALARAPKDVVHNQSINIGGNSENYQVRDVADQVKRLVPKANIVYTGEVGADPRDYRVKFDRLNTLLPEFRLEYSLQSGMDELFSAYIDHGFNKSDFEGNRYVRLRALKKTLPLLKEVAQ